MSEHISVLLKESIEGLVLNPSDRVFEGTVGLGGHSEEICRLLGKDGVYIGTDMDTKALKIAEARLASYPCKKILREGNFRNLDTVLDDAGYPTIDKVLLDIGLSNLQLEDSERGFSFRGESPLLMTFRAEPKEGDLTAYEIVNEWGEDSLTDIITGYGEERFAKRIAHAIVTHRTSKAIQTTGELAEIIRIAVPGFARTGKIHPATKTFQALRIAVNDELGALREGLKKGTERLAPGGRIAVISFHSLEDRIVKDFFKERAGEGVGTIITKKPLTPSEDELSRNPKSRSAKLRIFQKQ